MKSFEISKPFMLINLVCVVLISAGIFEELPYYKLAAFLMLAVIGVLSVIGYTNHANKEQSRSLSSVIPSWNTGWNFLFIVPVGVLAVLVAELLPGQTGVYTAIGIVVLGGALVVYLVTKKPKKKDKWGK